MAEAALTDTDKMIAAAEKFGDKLAQLATQYGPDVADVALLAAKVDAMSALATGVAPGLVALAGLAVAISSGRKLAERWSDNLAKDAAYMAPEGGERERVAASKAFLLAAVSTVLTGLGVFLLLGAGASALNRLTNVWAWVGVFEPKVWLAGKLLGWM
jgi:hypothetical protein